MEVKDKNVQEPKEKKGGCCGCLTVLILAFVFFNPFTWLMIYPHFFQNVSEPEIKYAEFPFELAYEFDGETYVYNDSIVCEYAGTEVFESGKERVWKTYIKSTNLDKLCYVDVSAYDKYVQDEGNFYIYGTIYNDGKFEEGYRVEIDGKYHDPEERLHFIELYYDIGFGEYFMGDDSTYDLTSPSFEYVEFSSQKPDGTVVIGSMTNEQASEIFGLKLVSWECAPPIENSFE